MTQLLPTLVLSRAEIMHSAATPRISSTVKPMAAVRSRRVRSDRSPPCGFKGGGMDPGEIDPGDVFGMVIVTDPAPW